MAARRVKMSEEAATVNETPVAETKEKKERKPRTPSPYQVVFRLTDADGNPVGKGDVNVEILAVTRDHATFGKTLVANVERGGIQHISFLSTTAE